VRVPTCLTHDELLEQLTSRPFLRPEDDALLFEEIARRTGGPDTFWAQAVRTALAQGRRSAPPEHRSEMRQRTEARGRAVAEILERFEAPRAAGITDTKLATLDRGEKRELSTILKTHGLESFVVWAARRRMTIERAEPIWAARGNQRAQAYRCDETFRRTPKRNPPRPRAAGDADGLAVSGNSGNHREDDTRERWHRVSTRQSALTLSVNEDIIATLTVVEARETLGRVSEKRTANTPHIIRGDDGIEYVLKPRKPDRQHANELLAFAIANVIGLPVLDAAVVYVGEGLRSISTPDFKALYSLGEHFGSKMERVGVWDFMNVSPALLHTAIRNKAAFYGLIAFDELVMNGDRATNAANLLAVQRHTDPPRHEFYAIDHGYAFGGPGWTLATLQARLPQPIFPVLATLQSFLTNRAKLTDEAGRLIEFVAEFGKAVEDARSGLDDADRAAVVEFVSGRAPLVQGWMCSPEYKSFLPALQ